MAKNSITDYSKTAASNTDIQSVDIDEGCLPSGINNAIREVMADLADVNDGTVALTSPSATALDVTNNITVGGTVDGRDVATDGTKLDGIEASATADQTASEIKTAYESNSDTNEFSDAEQTKLAGIEAAADVTDTTNVTAAGAAMLTGATFTGSITATEATFSGNTSVKLPAGTDAQRPTGVNGMLRYNSDDDQFEGYADGAWGAIAGGGETSLLEYNYTATAGQTTFSGADDNAATLAYVAANLIVTLNGIVLENGTDYTAANGTSIVLTVAAALNDELNIIAFSSFTVSDTVPASTGGTFSGNVNVTGNLGVGTTSPAYQIDIQGSSTNALRIKTSSPLLRLEDSDDNAHHTFIGSSDDLYITSDAGNTGNGNMIFRNGGSTERLRIESDGGLKHLSKPAYFARAWVNFNGTGTVSVRASGNVSSITDYGTGYYGVNFSAAMTDANYAPVAMGKPTTSSYGQSFTTNTHQSHTQTTSQVRIVNSYQDDNSNGVTYRDSAYMFLAVFR